MDLATVRQAARASAEAAERLLRESEKLHAEVVAYTKDAEELDRKHDELVKTERAIAVAREELQKVEREYGERKAQYDAWKSKLA